MSFADNYFKRYKSQPKIFSDNPCSNTGIIVVIPCFNDPFILKTLDSLESAKSIDCNIEVIVIVNSGENTDKSIVEENRRTFELLQELARKNHFTKFKLLPTLIEGTSRKIAGVGFARKTGMDEAIRRFDIIDNKDGIICSLDADTLVSEDYFTEIKHFYELNKKAGACIFQFQHNFDKTLFTSEEIEACKLYEIYLRYFRLSLEYTGFPYPIHTIGSCFSAKAENYCKAGGMSTRQGGEDFYFLHKLAPMCNIGIIRKAIVFPAPRISDRVPFGTGPSVRKIIGESSYKVYNFQLFVLLKQFFDNLEVIYQNSEDYTNLIPEEILQYSGMAYLNDTISECKSNSTNFQSFRKRFFSNFDAFYIIRFLNSFENDSSFEPEDVQVCTEKLLLEKNDSITIHNPESIYDLVLKADVQQ
jgi:hypothetical protein